ncbi:MAG: hypothetical protein QXP36_02145 [Conexivisphaerales archaeon]
MRAVRRGDSAGEERGWMSGKPDSELNPLSAYRGALWFWLFAF